MSNAQANVPFFQSNIGSILTVKAFLSNSARAFKCGRSPVSKARRVFDRAYYWPDDPLVAEATARIKPRKS